MSASPNPDGATARRPVVPTRLTDTATLGADWADGLAWPLPFPAVNDIVKGTLDRYIDAAMAIDDADSRAVAFMCRRFMTAHALIQFAHMIAADGGRSDFLGPDDLGVLDGSREATGFRSAETDLVPAAGAIRHRALRRAVRTASWTNWGRLPRALLRPDATVLNHNSLLRDYVATTGMAARQAYPDEIVSPGDPADPGLLGRVDAIGIGAHMAAALAAAPGLSDDLRARLETLLRPMMEDAAQEGLMALARLRAKRVLPRTVLSGTGSRFESRALGLEVMRRGGRVIRFGHAGAYPLMNSPSFLVQQELAVSTELVLCTAQAAAMPNVQTAQSRVADRREVSVRGHSGDPGLVPKHWSSRRKVAGRRRVMYVATAYFGFNQLFPPAPPEPYYVAWQARLTAMLNAMEIDLLLKPHPEGVRRQGGSATDVQGTVLDGRFEDVSELADVFLFDHPATTSLAVAMSTEQPIVLIDLGNMDFNAEASRLVRQRCRILQAGHDERNLPTLDPDELAEAIFDDGPVDPSPFRRLYLGDRTPA